MISGIGNHGNPSHYDLHIKNFNSNELKFLIEYQYELLIGHGMGIVAAFPFAAIHILPHIAMCGDHGIGECCGSVPDLPKCIAYKN